MARTTELSERNLGKLADIRLRKFREMLGKPMPEFSMTPRQREVYAMLKDTSMPGELFQHIPHRDNGEEMAKCLGAYYAALKYNSDGKWRESFQLLKLVYSEYLIRELKVCNQEIGDSARNMLLTTARAWTTIHANYLANHMERDLVPEEFRCGLITTDIWSIGGVVALGRAGMLSDLPIIKMLLQCGESTMEQTCRRAGRELIVREGLTHAFANASPAELDKLGAINRMQSEAQIIAKVGYAFYLYGLGDLLVHVSQAHGPFDLRHIHVAPDSPLGRLGRFGLDGKLEVCRSYTGDSYDLAMEYHAAKFLSETGLASREGDYGNMTLELTAKGKQIFKFLVRKMFGMEEVHIEFPEPVRLMLGAPKKVEA